MFWNVAGMGMGAILLVMSCDPGDVMELAFKSGTTKDIGEHFN